ncbi:hypothetical protein [Lacticaseibacillus sharpeae]|uniref:Uncharacterized protein n=1 Tax=Lacticaseibacillus sharpeae JCM 1186 = DSM 20505 TaxID=1291052 RepID=A0A0R1ZZ39_9LACO|nr:hypothetical protein [Lacticaseibacillus sharpeae]KRM56220.1 hypothetical protein FC18_GL000197 [Lacticaseibacillus sharpeae JCM 1186 = DSM 20505]
MTIKEQLDAMNTKDVADWTDDDQSRLDTMLKPFTDGWKLVHDLDKQLTEVKTALETANSAKVSMDALEQRDELKTKVVRLERVRNEARKDLEAIPRGDVRAAFRALNKDYTASAKDSSQPYIERMNQAMADLAIAETEFAYFCKNSNAQWQKKAQEFAGQTSITLGFDGDMGNAVAFQHNHMLLGVVYVNALIKEQEKNA